jgi:hypothetical protein
MTRVLRLRLAAVAAALPFALPPVVFAEALQPIYDSILNAVRRHYAYGLRLFLENGGRGLKIPISADQLTGLANGK